MKLIITIILIAGYALCNDLSVTLSPCKINYSIETRVVTEKMRHIRMPVDFFVVLHNNSDKIINIYDDDNSWGFECIKFILHNNENEYVVTKKPTIWYRNFESFISIKPHKFYRFPVVYSDVIWRFSGLNKHKKANLIRVIYDQPIKKTVSVALKGGDLWSGIISSPYYQITNIIKRIESKNSSASKSDE